MSRRPRGAEPELWQRALGEPDMTLKNGRSGYEWIPLGRDNPLRATAINKTGLCRVYDPNGDPDDEPHDPWQVHHVATQHVRAPISHLGNVHRREAARQAGEPVPPYEKQKNLYANSLKLLALQLNVPLGASLGALMPEVTSCCWEGRSGQLCGFNIEANIERNRPTQMKVHLDTHQRVLEDHDKDYFCYLCSAEHFATNDRSELAQHIHNRHGWERNSKHMSGLNESNCNIWALYLARKALVEVPQASAWASKYETDFIYDHTDDWPIPSNGISLPHFRHA